MDACFYFSSCIKAKVIRKSIPILLPYVHVSVFKDNNSQNYTVISNTIAVSLKKSSCNGGAVFVKHSSQLNATLFESAIDTLYIHMEYS